MGDQIHRWWLGGAEGSGGVCRMQPGVRCGLGLVTLLALSWVGLAAVLDDGEQVPNLPSSVTQPVPSSLLEIGEALRKDGCSGAYDKFKANIASMEKLKAKATKKAKDEERKQREPTSQLKQCKDGQKEVMVKAEWKKDKIQHKIKSEVEKKVGKQEKKLKESNEEKDKKLKKKVEGRKEGCQREGQGKGCEENGKEESEVR